MTRFRRILTPGEKPGEVLAKQTREYRTRNKSVKWGESDELLILDPTVAREIAKNGIPQDVSITPLEDHHLSDLDPATARILIQRSSAKRSGERPEGGREVFGNRTPGSSLFIGLISGLKTESPVRGNATGYDRVTEQVSARFEPATRLILALIRHAELRKVDTFRLQTRHYVAAGLASRGARSRALRSLEKKRLIRVFREPGRHPVIELNKDHRGLVIPWPNDFLQAVQTDRPT
ncbi:MULTISPECIES: hypothetical protein [unclassified Ruegeria]|uniref:hypothetical protein n=1 Tax=unclassified Ruegeria TaxID=2625375 RepID=UPI00149257DE|nr:MULTISPECIES: hypothetical protein [unclassified Ruegeria]NOD35437.1 hypothetical protein [Ruegeria sp. HKCCD7296]NOE42798.1 hypothetical protein [Ruegeria sp. HKCCD7319]